MGRVSQRAGGDDSGRESRLKLILLVVALVLVAAYAASVTKMHNILLGQASNLLRSGLLPIAGLTIATAVILAALVLFRRRRSGGIGPAKSVARHSGAHGRSDFLDALAGQIETHAKSGRQLALHLVDIDRFRSVNGILGEAEGDALLDLVHERLVVLANHVDRVARVGDDEFAIVQPEAGGARDAEIYARRIEETIRDVCARIPRPARPGASVGVAVFPEHGGDAATLVHNASLAQRAAKDGGGEGLRVFSRAIESAVESSRQSETMISEGLNKGWFELYFQPRYDLQTRRLTGFEALVRLNHPEHGTMLPERFLAAAETSGLIQPLGEWVIREAMSTAKDWPDHLTLAINLSRAEFSRADLADIVLGTAAKAGILPARLQLEIPEAVLRENDPDVTQSRLEKLRNGGAAVIVDDFGVGNSRLQAMSGPGVTAVKLDHSLVAHVGSDRTAEAFVRGLIDAARAFGLGVLAEGVERPDQAHFLMSNGCTRVQGFLFGRPSPASDLGSMIAKDLRKAAEDARETAPRLSTSAA
jgi:diguanylate cyclase (GGDEF)-like protein